MQVLWRTGPATVQTVQEQLSGRRRLAYNSVQTMLNVLLRKGRVRRRRHERAYEYAPALTRLQAAKQAVGELVHRMFDGSAEGLVMNLLETRQLRPEQLERLAARLDQSEGGDRGER
jgi:BlaI family penicillinase repressor